MEPPPRSEPATETRNIGLVVGGSVLGVAGLGLSVFGSLMFGLSANEGSSNERAGGETFAAALLVPGVLALAGGIAMIVVGAQQVPVGQPAKAAWAPQVSVGPTSARVVWSF
jgi:hypothetical protein